MSEYIEVGQPLQFTDPNTPTRVGEIVESVGDIYNIPSPRLGMQVFVKSEKKSFVITSLKNKTIGGVNVPEAAVEAFEPVGAKSITWDNYTNPSNMNDFVVAGVYDIKGVVGNNRGNLPIMNTGENASFAARLVVTVSPEGDTTYRHSIGQTMVVSNSEGKETKVYTRNANVTSYDGGASYVYEWGNWGELQRNVNVDTVTSLDHLVDNGIYSGVWKQGRINPNPIAFVCIVINDYFIGTAPRRVSQFVYGLSKFDGSVVYQSRVWDDSKNMWSDWEILNQKEISSMISAEIKKVTDGIDPNKIDSLKDIITWIEEHGDVADILAAIKGLSDGIGQEADARMYADNIIKRDGVLFGGFSNRLTTADEVIIGYKSIDQLHEGAFGIPAATTEKAGVMSADDKKSIITLDKVVVDKNTLSGLFATDSPQILSASSLTYKVDYIPIQNGGEYHIKATELSLVNGWIQIGTTTEIPAANVAIKNIVKYMDSTDKDVDMVYKSDIDGYLVCFYLSEQGYSFTKTVLRHIVPILTEKVEGIEDTVSSYNDVIYEREDVALAETVLSTLFLTGNSTTILQSTDSAYKLSYSRVEKGKIYKVINDNCSYPAGWAVVSFTTQIPAKGVPVTLLSFAKANTSAIDYSYTPSEDGYLCVTYKTSGADSRIYESKLTSTPTTAVLKDKVATLEKVAAKSSLILPPKFFAVVGYEFNIYWDTIYTTPDYGAGCPNYMVQAVCNIGANNQRSFRVTPTASQAGEHEITIQVYGVNGSLIDEKTSTLVVINPSAITVSNPKNILSLGDSTIDDSGYMIKNLYSSIADLGFGNKILPIGTRGFVGSRHEARTGYTYKGYLTTFKNCKIYVSNLSEIVASINELNVSPHPQFTAPDNSRIWVSDINVAEGWMTADNNILPDGWSGILQSRNTNIVNVSAVVTNVINNVDNIVLYKNNTVDFANYMANVYGDADKTIDVLTMANGINDCRGALRSQSQIDEIVDNAKAIIDAFLSYNQNGKVLIALPKIKASTLIEVYPSSYTLNSYNLRKKINEVFSSYDERVIIFGEVCGMDRFWGYPIAEREIAARISAKMVYNTDAVHPRNEGYLQIADTYLGALLYACKD